MANLRGIFGLAWQYLLIMPGGPARSVAGPPEGGA